MVDGRQTETMRPPEHAPLSMPARFIRLRPGLQTRSGIAFDPGSTHLLSWCSASRRQVIYCKVSRVSNVTASGFGDEGAAIPTDIASINIRMSAKERDFFAESLRNRATYLEFGCGGSTEIAVAVGCGFIVSVDSDAGWIARIKKNQR